jgi:hypothetical protein
MAETRHPAANALSIAGAALVIAGVAASGSFALVACAGALALGAGARLDRERVKP